MYHCVTRIFISIQDQMGQKLILLLVKGRLEPQLVYYYIKISRMHMDILDTYRLSLTHSIYFLVIFFYNSNKPVCIHIYIYIV